MYHLSTASKTALRKEEIVMDFFKDSLDSLKTVKGCDEVCLQVLLAARVYDEVFGYIEDATKTLPGAAAPGELPGEL